MCPFGWTPPTTPEWPSRGSLWAGNSLPELAPGPKRFREESEGGREEACVHMDGKSPGLIVVTAYTVRAIYLLRRELDSTRIVANSPDRGASPERTRPNIGGDFAPAKRRLLNR